MNLAHLYLLDMKDVIDRIREAENERVNGSTLFNTFDVFPNIPDYQENIFYTLYRYVLECIQLTLGR
jgi:hypothetical protein